MKLIYSESINCFSLFDIIRFILLFSSLLTFNAYASPLDEGKSFFNRASITGDSNHIGYLRAYELWRPLVEDGNIEAQYHISIIYMHGLGGVSRDVDKAKKLIMDSAEKGLPIAQYWMGFQHESGNYLEKDEEIALEWYLVSGESGFWLAIERLVKAYKYGELGLLADERMANKWKAKR